MLCNCMRVCCLLLFVFTMGKAGGQENFYNQDNLGAEETEKDTVSLDVRGLTDYLKYITFLPEKRIDSVYFYANTSLVPGRTAAFPAPSTGKRSAVSFWKG